ncbi:hypothetical protein LZ31DRAFT_483684 [Colletotrichum somersetense]|nr:hypothetical protein LZ31DRAFT_483684 [Colletotrichum somersetense]
MKSTLFTIIATLAASVAAIPVKSSDANVITMKRSEAIKLGLHKRKDSVTDSVNYILVLEENNDKADAYQEEVDAARAHPEDTLGH